MSGPAAAQLLRWCAGLVALDTLVVAVFALIVYAALGRIAALQSRCALLEAAAARPGVAETLAQPEHTAGRARLAAVLPAAPPAHTSPSPRSHP